MKSLALKLSIIAGAVILAASAILIYFYVIKPRGNDELKTVTVIIVSDLDGNNVRTFADIETNQAYLDGLLSELNEKENIGLILTESAYGKFVDGFFNKIAFEDNCWYQVYINDESALLGISDIAIENEAVYRFVLTEIGEW